MSSSLIYPSLLSLFTSCSILHILYPFRAAATCLWNQQSTLANWPIIELRPNADAVWLSITRITNLCYIVTFHLFPSLRVQGDPSSASNAGGIERNNVTMATRNLMRDEQMNICTGNVVFLDIQGMSGK